MLLGLRLKEKRKTKNNMNTPKEFIIHHTGGSDAAPLADSSNYSFEQCNTDHKVKFNMLSSLGYYVGYHYYIDKNGVVKQARADTDEGAHTKGRNSDSIGICLAGNFDSTLPTKAQTDSLKDLMAALAPKYKITVANPHRKYAAKTCYGNKLTDKWAQSILDSAYTPKKPVLEQPQGEKTYTPTREEAIKEIKRLSQYL